MLILLWTSQGGGAVEPPQPAPAGQAPAGSNKRPVRKLIAEDEKDWRGWFQEYRQPEAARTVKRIARIAAEIDTKEADNTLAEVESLLRQARQQRQHTEAVRSLAAQLKDHLEALERMKRAADEDEDDVETLLLAA